jgi:hypothetical protein
MRAEDTQRMLRLSAVLVSLYILIRDWRGRSR